MIQHVGGGRVVDHGPQKPYRGARSVVGGLTIGNAVGTPRQMLENVQGIPPGHRLTFIQALPDKSRAK